MHRSRMRGMIRDAKERKESGRSERLASADSVRKIVSAVVDCRFVTRPLIVGLTGNIATGKSTVLAYLRRRGADAIDADKLAHAALLPAGPAYGPAIEAFGAGIVRADGTIDRAALGRIVFADPAALARLEQLVHPAVFELAKAELAAQRGRSGDHRGDQAAGVRPSGPALRRDLGGDCHARRRSFDGWRKTALWSSRMHGQRMAAQSSQAAKVARATRVIDNSGTPEQLYAQLDLLWNELMESRAARSL